jgi:inorganic triphosphatase YgiF
VGGIRLNPRGVDGWLTRTRAPRSAAAAGSLKPIFETRVHRTTVPLRKNGSRIEVVFDEGKIHAGQKSAQINEVELELKRGKALDLFKTARLIGKHVPIKLALRTKSERGYDLTSDNAALSSRAERIELQRNTSTAEAFRIMGRSVLRHVVANAAAVQTADPEGVHQMRVGLRRLRTLIWLFKELLGAEQTERIKVATYGRASPPRKQAERSNQGASDIARIGPCCRRTNSSSSSGRSKCEPQIRFS